MLIPAHIHTGLEVFMATRTVFTEDIPFSLRLKSLSDEELLDIWAETQELERVLREEWGADVELAFEYEKYIILELRTRNFQKFFTCESDRQPRLIRKCGT